MCSAVLLIAVFTSNANCSSDETGKMLKVRKLRYFRFRKDIYLSVRMTYGSSVAFLADVSVQIIRTTKNYVGLIVNLTETTRCEKPSQGWRGHTHPIWLLYCMHGQSTLSRARSLRAPHDMVQVGQSMHTS